MTHLTNLEKIVFNAILKNSYSEYGATTEEIAKITNLEVKTIKGVQGSLNKKGLIENDQRQAGGRIWNESFPIVEGRPIAFGWDEYTEEEWNAFKVSL